LYLNGGIILKRQLVILILFILSVLTCSGCAAQIPQTEAGPGTTATNQATVAPSEPVENLSFYLNESQCTDNGQFRRFYLLKMEGVGCTDSITVIALTYRDHGHDMKELFTVDPAHFSTSVFEEGTVIELEFYPNSGYNQIIGVKIIDFAPDGKNYSYRS